MQDFLGPVEPVEVDTEIGAIYIHPTSGKRLTINAPHLTIDGIPLQASGFLISGDGRSWNFMQTYDSSTARFSVAADALRARLVDGRDADIIILGKIAQVIIPTVQKLAQTNPGLFLEAEKRRLKNEILALERLIEREREKLKKKEEELAAVERQLPGTPS
jgi:hypothetical protein